MKEEMIKSLKTRFAGIEENKLLSIVTIVNPRFKNKFSVVISLKQQLEKCWKKRYRKLLTTIEPSHSKLLYKSHQTQLQLQPNT